MLLPDCSAVFLAAPDNMSGWRNVIPCNRLAPDPDPGPRIGPSTS